MAKRQNPKAISPKAEKASAAILAHIANVSGNVRETLGKVDGSKLTKVDRTAANRTLWGAANRQAVKSGITSGKGAGREHATLAHLHAAAVGNVLTYKDSNGDTADLSAVPGLLTAVNRCKSAVVGLTADNATATDERTAFDALKSARAIRKAFLTSGKLANIDKPTASQVRLALKMYLAAIDKANSNPVTLDKREHDNGVIPASLTA